MNGIIHRYQEVGWGVQVQQLQPKYDSSSENIHYITHISGKYLNYTTTFLYILENIKKPDLWEVSENCSFSNLSLDMCPFSPALSNFMSYEERLW